MTHWRWYVYGLTIVGAACSWAVGYWGFAPFTIALALWAARYKVTYDTRTRPLSDAEISYYLDEWH